MKDKFKREVFEITTKEYISVCQYDYVDDMFKCPNCKTFKKICIYATDNNNNLIIKSKYCCNYNLDDFPQKTTNIKPVDLEENEKKKIKEKIKTYLDLKNKFKKQIKTIQNYHQNFFLVNQKSKEIETYHKLIKEYAERLKFAERLHNEIFTYIKPKLIKHVKKYNICEEDKIQIKNITILKDFIEYSFLIIGDFEMLLNSPTTKKVPFNEIFS